MRYLPSVLPPAVTKGLVDNRELFQAALGLAEPWFVDRVTFSADERQLDLCLCARSRFRGGEQARGSRCCSNNLRDLLSPYESGHEWVPVRSNVPSESLGELLPESTRMTAWLTAY